MLQMEASQHSPYLVLVVFFEEVVSFIVRNVILLVEPFGT